MFIEDYARIVIISYLSWNRSATSDYPREIFRGALSELTEWREFQTIPTDGCYDLYIYASGAQTKPFEKRLELINGEILDKTLNFKMPVSNLQVGIDMVPYIIREQLLHGSLVSFSM